MVKTSGAKKRSESGQRENEGMRRSRWRLERSEVVEWCGRAGRRVRLAVEGLGWVRRSEGGMCRVRCGFCQAHLGGSLVLVAIFQFLSCCF